MESLKSDLQSKLKIEISRFKEGILSFKFDDVLSFDILKVNSTSKGDKSLKISDIFGPNFDLDQEALRTLFDGYSIAKKDTFPDGHHETIIKAQLHFVYQQLQTYPVLQSLVRILKFWGLYMLRDSTFKSKSFLFELIAIHSVHSRDGSLEEHFIDCLKMMNRHIKIIFDDSLKTNSNISKIDLEHLNQMKAPLIVDPINPFKLFGTFAKKDVPWDNLEKAAQETLSRMYSDGFNLLHIFQPFLENKIKVGNVEFKICEFSSGFNTSYMIPHHDVPPASTNHLPIEDHCVQDFIMYKVIDCVLAFLAAFEVDYFLNYDIPK